MPKSATRIFPAKITAEDKYPSRDFILADAPREMLRGLTLKILAACRKANCIPEMGGRTCELADQTARIITAGKLEILFAYDLAVGNLVAHYRPKDPAM